MASSSCSTPHIPVSELALSDRDTASEFDIDFDVRSDDDTGDDESSDSNSDDENGDDYDDNDGDGNGDVSSSDEDDNTSATADGTQRTPLKAAKRSAPKDPTFDLELVDEMAGRIAQVDLETYWEFLPGEHIENIVAAEVLNDWKGTFSSIRVSSQEVRLYPQLVNAINTVLQNVPNSSKPLRCHRISEHGQDGENDLKPDLCFYPERSGQRVAVPNRADRSRTLWSWVDLPIEVKTTDALAPFNFKTSPKKLEVKDTGKGRESLAQITKYASEIQLCQHRLFVFGIYVVADRMRLMRWDRTGLVVTHSMNYVEDPHPLLNFLCRYARADLATRGYDPTVTRIRKTSKAYRKFEAYTPDNPWHLSYLKEMKDNVTHYPIRKIVCSLVSTTNETATGPTTGTYLIGRHRFGTHTPTGRGTKCYVAYDVEQDRLVFIKDYWCADHPDIHPELQVYELLRSKQVQNIATVIAGGDVEGTKAQRTRNQDYMVDLPQLPKPLLRYHHRIVIKQVGRPLETHTDQLELGRVLRDALIAHRDAYEKAKWLHRDVCPENILIDTETGTGFLSDWELSREVARLSIPASQPSRSGSWMTMSARLLQAPSLRHKLSDDLESFLYTADLMRLRFYPHNRTPKRLPDIVAVGPETNGRNKLLASYLSNMYLTKGSVFMGGPSAGGDAKLLALKAKKSSVVMPTSSPLKTFLEQLYDFFGQYYLAMEANQPFKELDDHKALLKFFEEFAGRTRCKVSKTPDQFEGLCSPDGRLPRRPSGSSRANVVPSALGAIVGGSSNNEGRRKRRKTTRTGAATR